MERKTRVYILGGRDGRRERGVLRRSWTNQRANTKYHGWSQEGPGDWKWGEKGKIGRQNVCQICLSWEPDVGKGMAACQGKETGMGGEIYFLLCKISQRE